MRSRARSFEKSGRRTSTLRAGASYDTAGPERVSSLWVLAMSASAYRYQPAPDRNMALRAQIVALAQSHRRYGSGTIYWKVRQSGLAVNPKRIEVFVQKKSCRCAAVSARRCRCRLEATSPSHARVRIEAWRKEYKKNDRKTRWVDSRQQTTPGNWQKKPLRRPLLQSLMLPNPRGGRGMTTHVRFSNSRKEGLTAAVTYIFV